MEGEGGVVGCVGGGVVGCGWRGGGWVIGCGERGRGSWVWGEREG